MNMHAAKFGAATQLWEYLARIEQMFGIKSTFDPHLLIEIDLVEHDRHQITLLDANAVLTGQHTANLDAKPQNVGTEIFGRLQFTRNIRIIKDERMEIAIACVKDIGDT
jgi:hypothetical protein